MGESVPGTIDAINGREIPFGPPPPKWLDKYGNPVVFRPIPGSRRYYAQVWRAPYIRPNGEYVAGKYQVEEITREQRALYERQIGVYAKRTLDSQRSYMYAEQRRLRRRRADLARGYATVEKDYTGGYKQFVSNPQYKADSAQLDLYHYLSQRTSIPPLQQNMLDSPQPDGTGFYWYRLKSGGYWYSQPVAIGDPDPNPPLGGNYGSGFIPTGDMARILVELGIRSPAEMQPVGQSALKGQRNTSTGAWVPSGYQMNYLQSIGIGRQ